MRVYAFRRVGFRVVLGLRVQGWGRLAVDLVYLLGVSKGICDFPDSRLSTSKFRDCFLGLGAWAWGLGG